MSVLVGQPSCDAAGHHSRHLPGAVADEHAVPANGDGVALGVLADQPGQAQVGHLPLGGLPLGDHFPLIFVEPDDVTGLDEHATGDTAVVQLPGVRISEHIAHFQEPDPLPPFLCGPDDFACFLLEGRRDPDFDEEPSGASVAPPAIVGLHDCGGEVRRDREVARQNTAHSGVRVAEIGRSVCLQRAVGHAAPARIAVLDENASERPHHRRQRAADFSPRGLTYAEVPRPSHSFERSGAQDARLVHHVRDRWSQIAPGSKTVCRSGLRPPARSVVQFEPLPQSPRGDPLEQSQ